MSKINKHIQIARTQTVRQSSMGEKSCLMIRDTLEKHYEKVEIVSLNNQADLDRIVSQQPDLVFLGVKRTSSTVTDANDDVWVSSYLHDNGINYTGSTHAAIKLDLHKNLAKQTVHAAGLPTAQYFMAMPGSHYTEQHLPIQFPLFVKPPTQGGGKGIGADSIVRDFPSYRRKVQSIYQRFSTNSLVESYLEGREFSVALLGHDDDLLAMPVELIADQDARGDRILGQQIKSEDNEQVVAVTDLVIRQQLIDLAKAIFRELGARDYGRIDMRMDSAGQLHFIEANLVPGLAQHDFVSYFTHACLLGDQMNYEDMILKIVDTSLARR